MAEAASPEHMDVGETIDSTHQQNLPNMRGM